MVLKYKENFSEKTRSVTLKSTEVVSEGAVPPYANAFAAKKMKRIEKDHSRMIKL